MEELKKITYDTLKHFKKEEIVLPSDYTDKFKQNASKLDVDLSDQDTIMEGINYEQVKLDRIVKQTNENLTTFSTSTKKAQVAIKQKDEQALASLQADIQNMQKQIEFLQKELFTDSLTRANNRKWLSDFYLDNDNFPSDGKIVFVDLNDLKHINDSLGHIVGDMAIKYLVNYLKKELLDIKEKYITRYAGDEFLVLFENPPASLDLEEKFKSIQENLIKRKLKPKNDGENKSFSFTFSFGVSDYKQGDDFSYILEVVDEKMYQNKKKMKS